MKSILVLVSLLFLAVSTVSFFTHIFTIYYAYPEISSWWGVFLTVIGLTIADLYWAYQWWGSSFAVFIVVVAAALCILKGLHSGLAAAVDDVELK
jgi:hypothetical protein